ncbi:hypothetical protein BKA82DRAFT_4160834 [Pisolithus tinctorius]|nr:hypothetical protein BKA82DRAFT_4160834 [Pisolithus tinctorius]
MNNPFQTSHLNRWTFRWNRRHSARNPNPHIHLHHTTLSLSLSHRSLHEYPHPPRLPRSRCHSRTSAKRKWRPRVYYLRLPRASRGRKRKLGSTLIARNRHHRANLGRARKEGLVRKDVNLLPCHCHRLRRCAFRTKVVQFADQASAEKFEARDDALPNGATGCNDRMHDVVSFAPDPPPPPLNSLAASANHVDSGASASASLVPVPTPAPTPSSMSTSSTSNSRATSVSASLPSHPSQYPRATYQSSASRRVSHEDGEILSSAFSKSPGPSSSRRPPPPPPPRSGPGPGPSSSVGTNALSRPLPSGPRALRGTMNQSSYPPPPPRPYSGSQYIPRGPSADRDRLDRERDRSWSASSRPRGRAGSTGWGR